MSIEYLMRRNVHRRNLLYYRNNQFLGCDVMFEAGLIAIGSLLMMGLTRLLPQNPPQRYTIPITLSDAPPAPIVEMPLVAQGQVSLHTPYHHASANPFQHLTYQDGYLQWWTQGYGWMRCDLKALQWVTQHQYEQSQTITIHWQLAQRWYIASFHVSHAEGRHLARILRPLMPNPILDAPAPLAPISAQLVGQTWHGKIEVGAKVHLYLLPNQLVVLQGHTVLAQISLQHIRRVIAIAKVSRRLSMSTQGIVRLHSATETIAFRLKHYSDFANHISDWAGCALDIIEPHDKTDKGIV